MHGGYIVGDASYVYASTTRSEAAPVGSSTILANLR
jgi:hypothetical protein